MTNKVKKRYDLQIMIFLVLVSGLIALTLCDLGSKEEHRFLDSGWEYSWGDCPPETAGSDGQWQPLKAFTEPPERNGQNFLWLRVLLPAEPIKNPIILAKFVQQTFEVYLDGKLQYNYGILPAPAGEEFRPWLPLHFIGLPDEAAGKMVYFRISSDAPAIGIKGVVEYGPMHGLFRYKNMMDLLKISSAALLFFAGVLVLGLYLFSRRETIYFTFAGNAILSAGVVFSSTYNSFLIYPNADFWNYFIFCSALGWKIFWFQFLVYIVEERYNRAVQIISWTISGVFCLFIIAAFVNPLWIETILLLHTVISVSCFLLILYFCRNQILYRQEVQFYAIGTAVWLITNTLDTLSILGVIYTPAFISWVGQFAEVSGLASVLLLRYAAIQNRMNEYSQDLEEFNKDLENIVNERTLDLSIQNACLEQLFDNSPDAMVMLNLNYQVTKANSSFELLFGYSEQEALGRELRTLLQIPGTGSVEEHIFDTSRMAQDVHLETIRFHKTGNPITVALTAYPFITETNQVGVYAVYRDISDRVLSERILRDSERRYRLLAENMEEGIWLLDFDRHLLYISPSLKKIMRSSLEGYLKKLRQELVNPQLDAAIHEVINSYYRGERSQVPVLLEEEIGNSANNSIWVETSITIAYDDKKEILGLLGITRDITNRKRTERLLAYSYERHRRSQFFSDISEGVLSAETEIYARARQLRINLPAQFALYFCMVEDSQHPASLEQRDVLLDEVANFISQQYAAEAWSMADGIGILSNLELIAGGKTAVMQNAEACLQLLQAEFPGKRFSIGVADYADSLQAFSRRLQHARTAARIGRQRSAASIVQHYEECGIYEIFDYFSGLEEAETFVVRTLQPLMAYDQANHTELVDTLEKLLSGNNLKDLAESLFVHYKTLASRKQRIEKVLHVSLDSAEDRMRLGAALQIRKMLMARKGAQ